MEPPKEEAPETGTRGVVEGAEAFEAGEVKPELGAAVAVVGQAEVEVL
jgi:hypothetical protein